jgi:tetratricopeptide (TPR) repeat protein
MQYDSLELLFKKIGDVNTDLDIYNRRELPPELANKLAELMVATINICALSKRLRTHGRLLTYAKGVLMGDDGEVTGQLAVFDRLQRGLGARVTALNYNNVLEVRDAVRVEAGKDEEFREEVRSRESNIEKFTIEALASAQHKDVLDALNPTRRHRMICNKFQNDRAKKSGIWLTSHDAYQAWLSRRRSLLWLSGGPGTGKSSLSSFIIEQLETQARDQSLESSRVSVAYFYFKEAESELRSFGTAIRTMAYDLGEDNPAFFKRLYRIFKDRKYVFQSVDLILREVFVPFFCDKGSQDVAYLVFDGLDEAFNQELDDFFKSLERIVKDGLGGLQILLVGRPNISSAMPDGLEQAISEIKLSATTNSDDIRLFIKEAMKTLTYFKQITTDVKADIQKILIKKAGGMFLWVQLMIQELMPYYRAQKIRSILQEAPAAVTDMISHILLRYSKMLKGDELSDFNEMVTWTVWARRPFKVWELQVLAQIGHDGAEMNFEEAIKSRYSSLFTFSGEGDINAPSATPGVSDAADKKQKPKQFSWADLLDDDSETDDEDRDGSGLEGDEPLVNFVHTSVRQYFQSGQGMMIGEVGIKSTPSQFYVLHVLLKSIVDCDKWKAIVENSEENVTNEEGEDGADGTDEDEDRDKDEDSDENEAESDKENDKTDKEQVDSNSQIIETEARHKYNTILSYAASNWYEHMSMVDLSTIPQDEKAQIVALLLRMFTDRETISNWIRRVPDFPEKWLKTTQNRHLVCEWLRQSRSTLKDDAANVVDELAQEDSLLKHVVDVIAGFWLDTYNAVDWRSQTLFESLEAYDASLAGTVDTPAVPAGEELSQTNPTQQITDRVRKIAKKHRPGEGTLWSICVGQTFRDFALELKDLQLGDQALAEIEPVLKYESEDWYWPALSMKADILLQQNKSNAAIAVKKLLMESMEKYGRAYTETPSYRDMMEDVAKWLHALGREEDALEQYRAILAAFPAYLDVVPTILRTLEQLGRHKEAMDLYRQLDGNAKEGLTELMLASFVEDVADFFPIMFKVARHENNLPWIEETLAKAIGKAEDSLRMPSGPKKWAKLQYWHVLLLEQYFEKREEAINLCESVIDRLGKMKRITSAKDVKKLLIETVCRLYVRQVEDADTESSKTLDYLDKVEGFKEAQVQDQTKDPYYATLAAGILHRLLDHPKDSDHCFREVVRAGIILLSDDDDSNDYEGYSRLSDTLVCAGPAHRDDCLSSFSLFYPNVGDVIEVLPGEDEQATYYTECSACFKSLALTGEWWVCTMCLNTQLCKDCGPKVTDGSIGFRICSPKHELFVVGKMGEPVEKGMVTHMGVVMPLKQWLARLKKTWNLK